MEKQNKKTQPHWALNVLDLHTKMTAWSFTTVEVVHFIMDIPGDGGESDEESMPRMRRLTQMTMTVAVAIQK